MPDQTQPTSPSVNPADEAGLGLAMDFAQAAVAISDAPDLPAARQRIVDLAVGTIGCDQAILWEFPIRATRLRVGAGTDPAFTEGLLELTRRTSTPAHFCLQNKTNVVLDDVGSDDRWPLFNHHLRTNTSIRSVAGFCLGEEGSIQSVLVLYCRNVGDFTADRVARASIFAAHASIAVQNATRGDQADNLAKALDSNRRIGMAIGVLVALYKVTDQQAFDLLRIGSQRTHVKLHEIADEVILTGAAPSWPDGPATKRPVDAVPDHGDIRLAPAP